MIDEPLVNRGGDRKANKIDVLLVDDNEQWAELLANDIEFAVNYISVTIAMSANEAMTSLRENESIDCVVADYQMPEIGGIELLEWVRDKWPEFPFILITGEGSEDVASRAIDAGVTDYLIKNPRADQQAVFVNKIESAVERYRLRQAVAESEERYRTVTEQSQDAIAIFRDVDDLIFCNERLVELTGLERTVLRETDVIAEAVHPEDRPGVREILGDWAVEEHTDALHETRFVSGEGKVRYCELAGTGITYEGQNATLVSIRDVTERVRRERELEWERRFNRTVQRVLVESRTRDQLEQAIADQLAGYGYPLVWFGDSSRDYPEPRVVSGDEAYLDAVTDRIDASDHDSEPSVWALRSGEPQFVSDFTELFETAWRDIALDQELRSGAAIPLIYEDISYGVLAVYADEPSSFDQTERKLLTDLGETVAFAAHNIEAERALSADTAIEIDLQLTTDTYYLTKIARTTELETGEGDLTVHGTLPHGEAQFIQYVSIEGMNVDQFREKAVEHSDVIDVQQISEATEDWPDRFQIQIDGPTPEARLSARGALVRSTTVKSEGAIIRIEIPPSGDLREIVDTLEDNFGSVSVLSRTEPQVSPSLDRVQMPVDLNQLTEKQANALQAAFHHGYFEQPRQSSASEVAESLDVAHSTFLQHLRVAQRKLLGDLYE